MLWLFNKKLSIVFDRSIILQVEGAEMDLQNQSWLT